MLSPPFVRIRQRIRPEGSSSSAGSSLSALVSSTHTGSPHVSPPSVDRITADQFRSGFVYSR